MQRLAPATPATAHTHTCEITQLLVVQQGAVHDLDAEQHTQAHKQKQIYKPKPAPNEQCAHEQAHTPTHTRRCTQTLTHTRTPLSHLTLTCTTTPAQ